MKLEFTMMLKPSVNHYSRSQQILLNQRKARHMGSNAKVMLITFFYVCEIVYCDLTKGQAVNQKFNLEFMQRLNENIRKKKSKSLKK